VVRRWTVRAKGLDMSVDLPIDSADGGVERIDVLEVQPHQKAVGDAPAQAICRSCTGRCTSMHFKEE